MNELIKKNVFSLMQKVLSDIFGDENETGLTPGKKLEPISPLI